MNIFAKIAVFVVVILIIAILINHFLPTGPDINNEGAMDPESAVVEQPPVVADSNTADKPIASRREMPPPRRRRLPTDPRHRPPPPNLKIPQSDRTPRQPLPERLQKKKEILEQQQPEYINVRAEQLYQMAVTESKIARKPMMTHKRMVDYCRQILRYYPNTKYAPMARELLRDMPESRRKRYNITDWELGLQTQNTEENQK